MKNLKNVEEQLPKIETKMISISKSWIDKSKLKGFLDHLQEIEDHMKFLRDNKDKVIKTDHVNKRIQELEPLVYGFYIGYQYSSFESGKGLV